MWASNFQIPTPHIVSWPFGIIDIVKSHVQLILHVAMFENEKKSLSKKPSVVALKYKD